MWTEMKLLREAGTHHKRPCGPQQRAGALCHAGKAPLTAAVWIVAYKAAHGGKDPSEDDDAVFGGGMALTWIQGSVVKLRR